MFAQVEQEGLAMGLGYAAAAHFDAVLTKLEEKAKSESGKKSTGIIGFLKVSLWVFNWSVIE